jgi:hypothetical protein
MIRIRHDKEMRASTKHDIHIGISIDVHHLHSSHIHFTPPPQLTQSPKSFSTILISAILRPKVPKLALTHNNTMFQIHSFEIHGCLAILHSRNLMFRMRVTEDSSGAETLEDDDAVGFGAVAEGREVFVDGDY